jgi:ssDNA-binding Zn-finger/Zn-ribbon topoisomerase 1
MECPACGSTLQEKLTQKKVLFLVCPRWPTCKVSGTPELLARFRSDARRETSDPTSIGKIAPSLAALRILQSKLNQAKTDEERASIRDEAKALMRRT